MKQGGNYITGEKKEAFELELKELKGPKRKEILDALAYAKSLGDLSENAEYHHAREEQAKLEERIGRIERILSSAEVVSGGGGDTIEIGSKVSVLKSGEDKKRNYEIVGSEEADMSLGKISNLSPFGRALFGKKKGDDVTFEAPSGKAHYKIIDVS